MPEIKRPYHRAPHIPVEVNDLHILDAALAYAEEGLVVGPVKAGEKNPGSLLGAGWQEKTSRNPKVIRAWYKKWPTAGVFIHTGPSGLAVFDLDKAEDLAELPEDVAAALRLGLFQRSRGTGARGHYVFRTGERLGNSAGGFAAWGDVHAGNGVIIAAPTTHAVARKPYQWEGFGVIPALPATLRGLLRTGGTESVAPVSEADFRAFTEQHTASTAPEKLSRPIEAFRRRVAEGESRHGALARALPWAFREAKTGTYAAAEVISRFKTAFEEAFADSSPGQRSRPDAHEFDNLVLWAVAQPDPAQAVETLWDMTPTLGLVQWWAREKFITPWSLLGVGILRALCAIPPTHVLPAIIGSSAPPNLFLALVGDSGSGKGIAEAVGREVFELQPPAAEDLYPGKPGSGEGIAKMFGTIHPKVGVVFEHTRVYMSLPEIDSFKTLSGRDGSTLSATLRELWSGETLGNDFSGATNKILVQAKRYRACLCVGVQPERGGPLFAGAEGGLPQRFMFAATQDPNMPEPTDDTAGLHPIPLPVWPSEHPEEWRCVMGTPVTAGELNELHVPAFVREHVRIARAMKMRKQSGGLDGHRLLLQEKIALGLAVIHGHTHGFDAEHWAMAELFLTHSDAVRDDMLIALGAASRREREGRARAEGQAGVVRDDAAHQAALNLVRKRVLDILHDLGDGEWAGRARIARDLSKRQKKLLEHVLDDLVQDNSIRISRAKSGNTDGVKYRPK